MHRVFFLITSSPQRNHFHNSGYHPPSEFERVHSHESEYGIRGGAVPEGEVILRKATSEGIALQQQKEKHCDSVQMHHSVSDELFWWKKWHLEISRLPDAIVIRWDKTIVITACERWMENICTCLFQILSPYGAVAKTAS